MPKDAKEKVVIVTGASSGIGAATVRRLVSEGWTVVAAARRKPPLRKLAAESDRIHTVSADVADPASAKTLVKTARGLGKLRGVVHSAGVFKPVPLAKEKFSDFEARFSVNVTAAARLLQAALKDLEKGGVFIGISSTAGMRPIPGYSGYVASKAALNLYLQSAALELAPKGIRVHAVAPGVVETPMVPHAKEAGAMHPLGRSGKPEDVAQAVAYLLRPETEWMTGVVLPVDGGISLT